MTLFFSFVQLLVVALICILATFAISALIDIKQGTTRFWRDKPTWGKDALPTELQWKALFSRYISSRYHRQSIRRDVLILLLCVSAGGALFILPQLSMQIPAISPPTHAQAPLTPYDAMSWPLSLSWMFTGAFFVAALYFLSVKMKGGPAETKLITRSLFGALISSLPVNIHELVSFTIDSKNPVNINGPLVRFGDSTPQTIAFHVPSTEAAGGAELDCGQDARVTIGANGAQTLARQPDDYTVWFEEDDPDVDFQKNGAYKADAGKVAKAIADTKLKNRKNLTGLLLIGSADKRFLDTPLLRKYGSNEAIAQRRILYTKAELQTIFSKMSGLERLPSTTIELFAGSAISGVDRTRKEIAADRSVRVCRFWG